MAFPVAAGRDAKLVERETGKHGIGNGYVG